MMKEIQKDESLQQVINVACLPGIVGHSLGMPDIHWGYGFPIGGVAAFDMEDGVVSPGGVGYDINCGVRLLKTGLCRVEISGKLESIVDSLFVNIPSGVGSHRKDLKLSQHEVKNVLKNGAQWAVSHGYGSKEDLEHIEEKGCIFGADPELVSTRAIERGLAQLGTLGSGNHFVEVGYPNVLAELSHVIGQPQATEPLRDWRLPIYFSSAEDGASVDEWSSIEQVSRLSRDEIIERLLRTELRLAMFGFLPGFAYLSGLPTELHIPRKNIPTTRTRRNAVALGGRYLGIYSLPSPAGWHVVGELGVNMLRYDTLPPIAIQPGDRVRLEKINSAQMMQLQTSPTTLLEYNSG